MQLSGTLTPSQIFINSAPTSNPPQVGDIVNAKDNTRDCFIVMSRGLESEETSKPAILLPFSKIKAINQSTLFNDYVVAGHLNIKA
jgi:hypothetical protein